jgi:hypothetical protein
VLAVWCEFEGRVRWVLHGNIGRVYIFCWKTEDFPCLNSLRAALDEWHSETKIK